MHSPCSVSLMESQLLIPHSSPCRNVTSEANAAIYIYLLISLLECSCFTVVCWLLLYNKVNQLYICIYPHVLSILRLPPTLPIPPLWVVTEHRADLPVLFTCFPLAIYFACGSVCVSMPPSHFVPAYPSSSLCRQVHSLRLRLYSCPALRFFRTFFFFLYSIYMY